MRFVRKSLFSFLLVLVLTSSPAGISSGEAPAGKITILFTHDLHSYFLPNRIAMEDGRISELGGYARLASLIGARRSSNRGGTVLVDAGDFSMGTLFHTVTMDAAPELRLMALMGYDVITFGNHDFDFSPDGLARVLERARSATARSNSGTRPHLISSNTVFSKALATAPATGDARLRRAFSDYPVEEYAILERSGIRIGFFGLLGKGAAEDAPNARPLTFADPVESARRMVERLRRGEKVDLVVCLSHSGTSETLEKSEDELLAQKVPGIDVIVSGHTHTVLSAPISVGKTLIVSSGCYGSYLGELELGFNKDKATELLSYRLHAVTSAIPGDKAVAREIGLFKKMVGRRYLARFGYQFDQPIAESPFNMETIASIYAGKRETGLGNLVADSYRYAVRRAEGDRYDHIHAAIVPCGVIRSSLTKGPQGLADVFRVVSLGRGPDGLAGSPLVTCYLDGRDLKSMLEVETTISSINRDAHLNVSGLRFAFNPCRLPFDRVTSILIQDADGQYRPVVDEKRYRICINYFTAGMLDYITRTSHGLITIRPKDREGRPVRDLKEAIVYESSRLEGTPENAPTKRELKEWSALAQFLASFPGSKGSSVPRIPERYRNPEGRILIVPSWNPVELLRGGNYLTYGTAGALVVVTILLAFLVHITARRGRRPDRKRVG